MDAVRSGLTLAQERFDGASVELLWVEADSRSLPFVDASFDGVYCFGLLHEFVGLSAIDDAE